MFGDLKINATEFTPKDLIELNFYNPARFAEECEKFKVNGLCQVMGNVHFNIGKINLVEPY